MKRIDYVFVLFLWFAQVTGAEDTISILQVKTYSNMQIDSIYNLLGHSELKPSYKLFYAGIKGYNALIREQRLNNYRYLTLIDFSLSSKLRRLWVIDLESMQVVHNSLVAHGKNTGEEFAIKFSNIPKTNMSSLGFYVTGGTYYGKYGLSLYLDGIESGINDNARKRAIVMHSAPYATRNFINKYGRLGRSYGCPALPPAKSTEIIETIKDKSCLFIYYPDKNYLVKSKYINAA